MSVDLDFSQHQVIFVKSDGFRVSFPLKQETVASFYRRFKDALEYLDIKTEFDPHPNELAEDTAFFADTIHGTYITSQAQRFWQILVRVDQVMKTFRSEFIGKCSPVHFFWGSFDLAVTRFSGRRAPLHPGGVPHLPDRVAREAYSHEVSSCGFWPGNEIYPHSAFYSYAYPEPKGFKQAKIYPKDAFYHDKLCEFVLPYEAVRNASDPETEVMRFFRSTYETAANLDNWDRDALERSDLLTELRNGGRAADWSAGW
jgi:hypothetical protein